MIDKLVEESYQCTGCHSCMSICPMNSIAMVADDEGFLYPQVNYDTCIHCGKCLEVCSIGKTEAFTGVPDAYFFSNEDNAIKDISSSGGIFDALANKVLKDQGCIFGVVLNEQLEVVHTMASNQSELGPMHGSKYVQSRIGNTFIEVKKQLDQGRLVLFTGTPCQVDGLLKFLRKPYEQLICVDFICHGVPSPKVWKRYLDYLRSNYKQPLDNIRFRNKSNGWKMFRFSFELKDGRTIIEDAFRNYFMRAFLKDYSLRPSCYTCRHKGINRVSDMTIADFWGLNLIDASLDDDSGASLLLIHSVKGQKIFDAIKDTGRHQSVNIDEAVKGNQAALKSVTMGEHRGDFFEDLDKMRFDHLIKKYCMDSLLKRGMRKLGLVK